MRYAVAYRPPYQVTDRDVRKQYEQLDAASPEAAAAEIERRHPGFEAWNVNEVVVLHRAVLNLHGLPMHEIYRSMIVNGYFEEIADALPEGACAKVADEMTRYIHHEPDNAETVLLHAVRFLVDLVRTEEEAKQAAVFEAKHKSLSDHYRALETSVKTTWENARRRVVEESGATLRRFNTVHDMALTARASGRKTMPAREIIEAVGLDMDGWEDR